MKTKTLTGHHINECNEAIRITADEPDPNNGNASHAYVLQWLGKDDEEWRLELKFQNGPIKEVGTNGITQEALLAILIDRLEGFQSSKYACLENAEALLCFQAAQKALHARTLKRLERGVEGTHTV
jgi:hypothetical protein